MGLSTEDRGTLQEGRQGTAQSGHKNASRARRRRSRSSSRCHSRTLSHRDWSGYSCCSPPNTLPRCHCREPLSPSSNTTPKLSSAVNIPAYAQSSCSVGGMAWASLDNDEVGEDDFQTHIPQYAAWLDEMGGSQREPATERMEASRESSLVVGCPGGHW